DDGAGHDGQLAVGIAVGALFGVQPRPGGHVDVAVLVVIAGVDGGRGGPGGRVGQGHLRAVPAWSSAGAGCAWGCGGVEAAVATDTDQDLHARVGEFDLEPGGVVAAIEDDRCHHGGYVQPWQQVLDLAGGDHVDV